MIPTNNQGDQAYTTTVKQVIKPEQEPNQNANGLKSEENRQASNLLHIANNKDNLSFEASDSFDINKPTGNLLKKLKESKFKK